MKNQKRFILKTGFSKAGVLSGIVCFVFLCSSCAPGKAPPAQTAAENPPSVQTAVSIPPSSIPTIRPSETATASPATSAPVSFAEQAVCTADEFVNIRKQADSAAAIIGKLPAGETAGVIEYSGDWAHIAYGGVTGYVSRAYLIGLSSPSAPVPAGEWASILVNPSHPLPQDFKVSVAGFAGGQVDERILEICRQMFDDAKEDGADFELVDAYRSFDRQNELYQQKVDSYIAKGYSREDAEAEAATITARPNTSEHQTGLALDIVSSSYTARDKGFAGTEAFQWLRANAQNYGFTLRYPQGKTQFTGVIYEPWHWRFVGVQAAREMKKSGECLEEYSGATK